MALSIYRYILLLCFFSMGYLVATTPAGAFTLTVNQDRITLISETSSMHSILEELSKRTGVRLHSYTSLDQPVIADLSDISLQRCLQLLLQDYNHSLVYQQVDRQEHDKLKTIFITSYQGKSNVVIKAPQNEKPIVISPPSHIPEYATQPGEVHLFAQTPMDTDPSQNMMAIDPLNPLLNDMESPPGHRLK